MVHHESHKSGETTEACKIDKDCGQWVGGRPGLASDGFRVAGKDANLFIPGGLLGDKYRVGWALMATPAPQRQSGNGLLISISHFQEFSEKNMEFKVVNICLKREIEQP